jgi:hypothetical protein
MTVTTVASNADIDAQTFAILIIVTGIPPKTLISPEQN